MTIIDRRLSNGMRIVGQKMPYFKSVSVGIWVAAGSVRESESQAGISHFIEHMLFKGTQKRSAEQIAIEMDAIGAQINAYTAKENTCYYAKATDDRLEDVIDILSDIVLHSKFDPQEMEKEKGVVLEEIAMAEDTPDDLVLELLYKVLFKNHPLGEPILGQKETLKAFTAKDLRDYCAKHYTTETVLLSIAGNFDEDQLIELAEQYFADLPSGERETFPAPASRAQKELAIIEKDVEQVQICLGLPGYALRDESYYPLLLLSNALGGSLSSRLFQKIREDMGLAYSVSSFPLGYQNCGGLCVYAGCAPENAIQVMELILKELRQIKTDGLSNDEFERNKNQLKGSFILSSEGVGARMNAIGKSALLFGNIQTEEDTLKRIEVINMENTRAILHNVFDEEALVVSLVGRIEKQRQSIEALW